MVLKVCNPVTPGQRGAVFVRHDKVSKGRPYKALSYGISRTGGRNSYGRTTAFRKSGGHKRLYRMIDFVRCRDNVEAVVNSIEYDPNRTAYIALIAYSDGHKSYIVAPEGLDVGDSVVSGDSVDISVGNCLPLRNIPVGTVVHNVEMRPGKGAQIGRSAGCSVQLMGKDADMVLLRLMSGEVRMVNSQCRAVIGSISNADHQNIKIGKAGRNRWKGVKPSVRGVAMNPVDHPHGGGEGKTSGGRPGVTPWGQSTKGKRTRRNKVTSKYIVRRRYNK